MRILYAPFNHSASRIHTGNDFTRTSVGSDRVERGIRSFSANSGASPCGVHCRGAHLAYVCLSQGPPLGFSENILRHSRREGFPGDPFSHLQFGLEKCRRNQPQFHQDRRDSPDDRVFPDGTGVAGLANIYMELGFTFGRLVRRIRWSVRICPVRSSRRARSTVCCGGIGSICYDTPQRQVKAFRRFWIPDQLVKKHYYLSLASEVKELTF